MHPEPPDATTLNGIAAIGNRAILDRPLLALACSARCPPGLILPAYDLAAALRDAGVPTVGGFHTPIEWDCLHFLLKGTQPVVVCPARGIAGMRVRPAWKWPLADGRLLVLSPFPPEERRTTARLGEARNRFVARLAAAALVVHAAPGGRTEAWSRALLEAGKPVWTIDDPANAPLVELGVRAARVDELPEILSRQLDGEPRVGNYSISP